MAPKYDINHLKDWFTPLYIKFAPPAVSDPNHPNYLREHILYVIVFLGVSVGGLVVFFTIPELISRQFWFLLYVVIVVYLVCVFIFISPKLPFVFRSSFVCISLYVIGLSVLFSVGPFIASREWIFSFCIISSLFLGWTGAIFSLILFTSTLIAIGITIKSDYWAHLNITSSLFPDWLHTATDSFFLAVTLTILVTFIFRKLGNQIKEHQITEAKLIRNEATLESFINNIPGRAFLKNETGRYILGNRQVHSDFNMSEAEDLSAITDFDVFEASTAKAHQEKDDLVRITGQPVTFEETVLMGGKEQNHLIVKFPIESDGSASGLVGGIILDITDQKKAEQELIESRGKYRLLADNVSDNIWIFDLSTMKFTYVSPSVTNITGFTSEEAMEFGLEDVLTPASMEKAGKVLMENLALSNENPGAPITQTIELEQKRKDGSTVWTEISTKFVYDEDGRPKAVLGVTRDIDDRIKLQSQLRQAQKMEAVGTLAGGIAHDFNNILALVMGFGELAQQKALAKTDNLQDIGQIIDAADRARNLVKQLLAFSRRSETDFKAHDLNQLVIQCANIIKHTFPKMIDVQVNLGQDLNSIQADETQIEQIIMNLANNAKDAMPEGGHLVIETTNEYLDSEFCKDNLLNSEGEFTLLKITDDGHGMDLNIQDRIFDPFFTTKEIGAGTGLGLSTVYGIVRDHRGHISFSSAQGEGTTFYVYLPAHNANPENSPEFDFSDLAQAEGTGTILLVDDEENIRQLGTEVLQGEGYSVRAAENGETAVELVKDKSIEFDLVILDLGMPGMGGEKCMGELLSINPGMKILVASGYSDSGKVKDTLEKGATAFITKPYKIQSLVQKIREVLAD